MSRSAEHIIRYSLVDVAATFRSLEHGQEGLGVAGLGRAQCRVPLEFVGRSGEEGEDGGEKKSPTCVVRDGWIRLGCAINCVSWEARKSTHTPQALTPCSPSIDTISMWPLLDAVNMG